MKQLQEIMGTRYLHDRYLSGLKEKTKGIKELDIQRIRASLHIVRELLNMQMNGVTIVDTDNERINEILANNMKIIKENKNINKLEGVEIVSSVGNVLSDTLLIKNEGDNNKVYYLTPSSDTSSVQVAILLLILAKEKRIDAGNKISKIFDIFRQYSIISDWLVEDEFYEVVGDAIIEVKADREGTVTTVEGNKYRKETYVHLHACIPRRLLDAEFGTSNPNTPLYAIMFMKQLTREIDVIERYNTKRTMADYISQ